MKYRFGAVTVDADRHEVHVGAEHRPTEPQVIAVLVHLIEQRHRVVSKDDLLDAVWGTHFVSAAAVTSRIKSARQAIGDSGRAQAMIRTVHGRGYRFVAELDDGGYEPEAAAAGSPALLDADDDAGTRRFDDGWPLVGRDHQRDRAVSAAVRGIGGGLLLTGPAGLGKTRLARAVIEGAAQRGLPVARIHGHQGAATVPLGAIAHLLPTEVTEIADVQGEMARTVLLQRARAAIKELAGDARLVLMVDDVDRVDALSQALLSSLIADETIFAVMTQRTGDGDVLAMDHLVRSGVVDHQTLRTIPDDQMIALLGRVLDGPVQPMTSESLVAASGGVPGVLRQLVEAGLSTGTLTMRGGVWRLTGSVTPPGDMTAAVQTRLGDLDDEQRDALELLAIAGDLELDLAFELVADEVLDRLELDGMISVREVGASTRLRLSHPLYAEILLASISPLRDRRHRSRLARALAEHAGTSAADRLQLVRLQVESGADVDDALLTESAALALIETDTTLALRLLKMVPEHERSARHRQLLGEALYLRGRFDEAYEVWQSIELDDLDYPTAAAVLRRIATWTFYGKFRYVDAIESLDQQMQRFDGEPRLSLESYWCEIAAMDGQRADEAIERAQRFLPTATTYARADFLAGAAMAHFVRGRYDTALECILECNEVAADLERTVLWTSSAYANFVEILVYVELGRLDDGWATLDRVLGPGAAPDFGFEAIAAGRLALSSGRWQQVLDWLEPKIQITEALGITTNGRPLQATAGVAALMLGRADTASEMAEAMRSDVPSHVSITSLDIRWAIGRIDAELGDRDRAVDELLAHAVDARAARLHYMESLLLTAAAHAGGADRATGRLADLVDVVDGDLITLRHRSAEVLAGRGDPDGLLTDLRTAGLEFEAANVGAALAR